jgi:large subunit ribosomal protein L4
MAKVSLYNVTGNTSTDIDLNDQVFGVDPNQIVLQEIVVAYLANQRQGNASTKRRDEVRGGGKKPWKQKGTGNARAGSTRSPVWVGGGSVFGPKPRKYTQKINKQKKDVALKSALSERLRDGGLIVVDSFKMESIKTRQVVELLSKLNVSRSALMIMDQAEELFIKSARNIPCVKLSSINNINTYDLLRFEKVIFDKAAIDKIEKSLIG